MRMDFMERRANGTLPAALALIACAVVLWPGSELGAEQPVDAEQIERPRASSVVVLDGAYEIVRPTGWEFSTPSRGTVARLRSAGDDTARMEVRVSEQIPQQRWDRYRQTFHTELQHAGFRIYSSATSKNRAGKRGIQQEYTLHRDEEDHRLVVWHTHEDERAWVFTVFFNDSRRDAHLRTFESLLEGMTWSQTDE